MTNIVVEFDGTNFVPEHPVTCCGHESDRSNWETSRAARPRNPVLPAMPIGSEILSQIRATLRSAYVRTKRCDRSGCGRDAFSTPLSIIDPQFPRDARFGRNRQFLGHAAATAAPAGHYLPKLCSKLCGKSRLTSGKQTFQSWPLLIPAQYGLQVVPDPVQFPEYANCAVADLLSANAVIGWLSEMPSTVCRSPSLHPAQCLLTWNARHYQGKLSVPALTRRRVTASESCLVPSQRCPTDQPCPRTFSPAPKTNTTWS